MRAMDAACACDVGRCLCWRLKGRDSAAGLALPKWALPIGTYHAPVLQPTCTYACARLRLLQIAERLRVSLANCIEKQDMIELIQRSNSQ